MRFVVVLTFVLALIFAQLGCGGESDDAGEARGQTTATTEIRGPDPPPGSSVVLREVYRNFQPPLPNPTIRGSSRAIAAGRRACAGKTPAQVKREFIARSELTADQRRALADLTRFESRPSGNFPAGQLAALVYGNTLKDELAGEGYRGCVYALGRELKRQLAPKNDK